jgi:hypothetical protein
MAKKPKEPEMQMIRATRRLSVRGEFVEMFKEHPELLGNRNNDEITEIWLKRHPEHSEMPQNVRNTLANVKSQLRKKERRSKLGPNGINGLGKLMVNGNSNAAIDLEGLEVRIDEALTVARSLDPTTFDIHGLESVVKLLRRARNEVVWMLGQ